MLILFDVVFLLMFSSLLLLLLLIASSRLLFFVVTADAIMCDITLDSATVAQNDATGAGANGGAILLRTNSRLVTLGATSFENNFAGGSGGAVGCDDCQHSILSDSTTLVGNTAFIPLPSCPKSTNTFFTNQRGPQGLSCTCAKDSYSQTEGSMVVCYKCPARSVSPAGSTSYDACTCLSGTYLVVDIKGTKECLSCPVNSELVRSTGPVNVACACSDDYYGEVKDNKMTCIKCDSDKTSTPGSAMCKCRKGTHYLADAVNQTCSFCPNGADCSADNGLELEDLFALPGFWRPHPTSESFSPCAVAYKGTQTFKKEMAEKRCCPLNSTTGISICSNLTFTSPHEQCPTGYSGVLCRVCAKGWVPIDLTCEKCPSGASLSLAFVAMAVTTIPMFLIFLIVLMCAGKKDAAEQHKEASGAMGQFKIILAYVQIMGSSVSF